MLQIKALYRACSDLEIDVLVNNAGVMHRGDFSEQSCASIDTIVQLNIASLSRLFLQPMLQLRWLNRRMQVMFNNRLPDSKGT